MSAQSCDQLKRLMRIQLWSYNYDPEPTGIGPVSTVWARSLAARGHEVEVVAAHPHYPSPDWGTSRRPYRETRDDITVLRLPLWIGRESGAQRVRQELSFMASQSVALPALGRPDVVVSVSPSFPALLPGVFNARLRRMPWVLWLHDLLPDGAVETGLVDEGLVLRLSRWLERTAYEVADRVVVLSAPHAENLREKGVPERKLHLIYDPATRGVRDEPPPEAGDGPPRLLCIGNIGHTQGLAPLVRAFDRSPELERIGARLVITGDGVAAEEVRQQIATDRVEMLGVVSDERLELELQSATLALVTQRYEGTEFNLPSKLMNFMGYGLPVMAAVNPTSEVARIVDESGGGWVVDSSKPESFPKEVAAVASDPVELARRARSSWEYARERFSREGFASQFEEVLREVVNDRRA